MKKICAAVLAAMLAASLTACRDDYTKEGGEITTADVEKLMASTETSMVETELTTLETETVTVSEPSSSKLVVDRKGNLIIVPDEINRIVSTSPEVTEMIVALGAGHKLVAADIGSSGIPGISPTICTLDTDNLNIKQLEAISPDVVIAYGDISAEAEGLNVISIPESENIAAIKMDIEFISSYISEEKKGAEMIEAIDRAVADVSDRTAGIDAKRKVYFEVTAAPAFETCGGGTLENELIELAGGENVFGAESGVIVKTPEEIIAANPEVIITSVSYEGYDTADIFARTGWGGIAAVKQGAVHQVGTVTPTHTVADRIYEIARAIYPELYME